MSDDRSIDPSRGGKQLRVRVSKVKMKMKQKASKWGVTI